MPLALPNLDDKTYQQLVDEATAMIPSIAPQWTNYNPSDPGITLVELFAWFTEMLLYRINRVTPANIQAFLRLLNGPDWVPAQGQTLQDQIQQTVLELRTPQRAVTAADFELLSLQADPSVARVKAFPRLNLSAETTDGSPISAPGYMSVVILPMAGLSVSNPTPSAALLNAVSNFLDPRRLITTVVKVVAPNYIAVQITATLVLLGDADPAAVRAAATSAVLSLTHPILGGFDGNGWPFGQGLYASDLYALLGSIPGVDYVQDPIGIETTQNRSVTGADGVIGVVPFAGELINISTFNLTLEAADGSSV